MNQKLRTLREKHHLSQKQVADLLGISQSAYSQIEKGSVALSVEHLKTLCKEYDVSMDWLAMDKGPMKPPSQHDSYIPLINTSAVAGYLQNLSDPHSYISQLDVFKIPGFEEGNYRIFEVIGNSMQPSLMQNDYVICSVANVDDVLEGSICVVVEKNRISVKRIFFSAGEGANYTLRSDNPEFKAYQISDDELRELWLVNAKLTNSFMVQRASGSQEVRLKKLEDEFTSIKNQLGQLLQTFRS